MELPFLCKVNIPQPYKLSTTSPDYVTIYRHNPKIVTCLAVQNNYMPTLTSHILDNTLLCICITYNVHIIYMIRSSDVVTSHMMSTVYYKVVAAILRMLRLLAEIFGRK